MCNVLFGREWREEFLVFVIYKMWWIVVMFVSFYYVLVFIIVVDMFEEIGYGIVGIFFLCFWVFGGCVDGRYWIWN